MSEGLFCHRDSFPPYSEVTYSSMSFNDDFYVSPSSANKPFPALPHLPIQQLDPGAQLPFIRFGVYEIVDASSTPLPVNLLSRVFTYLPRSSLPTMLRVNSAFYRGAIELLHEHLILASDGLWPRFVDAEIGATIPPKHGDHPSADAEHQNLMAGVVKEFCRQYALNRSWLVNVVRTVDVHAHSTRICLPDNETYSVVSSQTLPALPALAVLRVHMTNAFSTSRIQRTFHITTLEHGFSPRSHLLPQCPALYRLRPRKLVVLGGPCTQGNKSLTMLPYELLSAVDKYVAVLSPDVSLILAPPASPVPIIRAGSIISDIHNVSNAEHIVIIFYTPRPGLNWEGTVDTIRYGGQLAETWAGRFLGELARCVADLPSWQKVTVVNAGSIDEHGMGTADWNEEEGMLAAELHFRAELAKTIDPLSYIDAMDSDDERELKAMTNDPNASFFSYSSYQSNVRQSIDAIDDSDNERELKAVTNDPDASFTSLTSLTSYTSRYSHRSSNTRYPGSVQKTRYASSLKHWARASTVDFITMNDYLNTTDVVNEFEHHEIEEWLQQFDDANTPGASRASRASKTSSASSSPYSSTPTKLQTSPKKFRAPRFETKEPRARSA